MPDIAEAVEAELARLAPAGALGAAVSGGGDSTALLLICARWARAEGRAFFVATVDHGLRSESRAEATAVSALCARLEVPHEILTATGLTEAAGNLLAAAREMRFRLLGAWARRNGVAAVLLGHTMDDQAETVLMRLARGSGVEGLSAMRPAVRHAGLLWLRPLLGIRRVALREFLRAEGVSWIEDPTNEDPHYDRVRARRALAALEPLGLTIAGLAATAERLQRQRRVLEQALAALAARTRRWGPFGEAWLALVSLLEDEEDTALRLLADTLMRVAGAAYRPRFASLVALLARLRKGENVAATLGGCLIRASGTGWVLIAREPGTCAPHQPLAGDDLIWDRRWHIATRGRWPEGAAVGALGKTGLWILRAAVREGVWEPSPLWRSTPREVGETTPALWVGTHGEEPALLAAPLAGYFDRVHVGRGLTISARFLHGGELPFSAPPD